MTATPKEAEAFASYMSRHFGAHLVDSNSPIIDLIGIILGLATQKMVDIDKFMMRHAVTIGSFIYLPDGLNPDQIIYVVTHECEHVHQFYQDKLGFTWLYLSEPEMRTHYEADAYGAEYELRFARTNALPDLATMVWPLEVPMYLLGKDEIEFGRQLFAVRGTQIAAKVFVSHAGRAAIKYLKDNAPHLLHESFR